MFSLKSFAIFTAAAVIGVHAETHTIHFDNKCGFGTPTLVVGGQIISTGGDSTFNGPVRGFGYLQTGGCGLNGEGCTVVEFNLVNGNSTADISTIPPYKFSGPVGFYFYNGCDGVGAHCTSAVCPLAFHQSNDNQALIQCTAPNVDLAITFCD